MIDVSFIYKIGRWPEVPYFSIKSDCLAAKVLAIGDLDTAPNPQATVKAGADATVSEAGIDSGTGGGGEFVSTTGVGA